MDLLQQCLCLAASLTLAEQFFELVEHHDGEDSVPFSIGEFATCEIVPKEVYRCPVGLLLHHVHDAHRAPYLADGMLHGIGDDVLVGMALLGYAEA